MIKDTGVTKETLFIQNGAEKDYRAVWGGLFLNNSLYKKKIGTNFAYFDNTTKSKAKVQQ